MHSPLPRLRASATALLLCFSLLSAQAVVLAQRARTLAPVQSAQTVQLDQESVGGGAPPATEFDEGTANVTFSNTSAITLTDGATPPTPANPYPSTINVTGLTGNVAKVTVTINGYNHSFPDDTDMMLVAPNGAKLIIWSDVGGSTAASNITITLDDAAASPIPDAGPLASGTFRPTAVNTTDTFPAPAPAPVHPTDDAAPGGTATFASKFNGMTAAQANGTWSLYIVDDLSGDGGSISGGWSLDITQTAAPLAPGALLISEFRVRGPNGANDEFIEIYNNAGSDVTVADVGGGAGYAIAASDGVARCIIPNGTVIPNRGHYLCVNSVGYSLASYPAGNGTTATGDATYTTDIPDNAGIALFQTSLSAGFTLSNRLDAVGSTSEANTLYKEGTGYPALAALSIEYSFYRDNCGKSGSITTFGNCPSGGSVVDTDNNATNFVFVDTAHTSTAAGQRLGAPGPENLSSPIQRNASFTSSALDPCVGAASPPNRVRDFTSDPGNNSTFGTMDIRRTYTNNTGGNVTRLRFRIIDITTFPASSGIADLRARTSSSVVVTVDRAPCGSGTSNVTVQGTTLEQPPSQPEGGGFNSSLSAGTVTLATPLANGASIDLRFLLGIEQTGNFKFYINIEALP